MNYNKLTSLLSNDTNSFNDSLICHPFLLERGRKSQYGLCDDEVSAVVIAAILLFIHTCIFLKAVISLLYKLYKLKQQDTDSKKVNFLTVARNPALMIFGTLFGYICCFILDLRILVGRKIFPCFIFTLDYHFSVPALSCAFILRFIRLVVLTWLNSVKVRVGKRQMLRGSMEDAAIMGTAVSEVAMHELVQQQQLHVIPSMSSDISAVTVGNDVTTTVEIPKSSKTKSPSSEELVFFKKDTYFQNFEKGKLIHVLKFLVSSKFIYITFAIIGFIHLSVYFIVGGVDYYNYTHDIKNPNKKQAFVVDTFVFAAANGCGTGTYHTNMYISYLSIYAFVGIVFAVGALFMKRDIWYVKREIVLTVVNWSFFALVYAVVNLFSQVTTLVDYFVPVAQMTVQIACILDNITTTILPVMYQQIEKKKDSQTNLTLENDDGNRIRKILLNSKWNSLFLQFSEKSFSSEDIMMWNAVEQFKKVNSEKLRMELFFKICETYLLLGAPLELNIPRKEFGVPEIMTLPFSQITQLK